MLNDIEMESLSPIVKWAHDISFSIVTFYTIMNEEGSLFLIY